MKRYKLLKDLPTFKAGDEFYLNDDGDLVSADKRSIIAYSERTLRKFPGILRDWFEEVPEKYKRWRAEFGENYYYHNCGQVYISVEAGDEVDNREYTVGNYFKAKEEAEKYGEYLKALQIIKDDAKGFEPDWSGPKQTKFYVSYNHKDSMFSIDFEYYIQGQGLIYFAKRKDAQESIDKHLKEWLIVLGVEDKDND